MSVSTTADLTRVPLRSGSRGSGTSAAMAICCAGPWRTRALFSSSRAGQSLLVAAGATLVSLLLAIPAAFSFSRYPGRDGWLYAGLGIYMVPPVAFVLPLYFILEHFGLLNTRSGLVLVYCSLIVPFLTWMVKTSSDTLPQDIEQAAGLTVCASGRSCCASLCRWRNRMLGAAALFGWLLAWDEFSMRYCSPATSPPKRCR